MLIQWIVAKIKRDVCATDLHVGTSAADAQNDSAVEGAARLFRALGEAPRLRLLVHLLNGERCVGDLANLESETLSTISQRLRVLRSENVIVRRRQGKHVNYALADRHIADLIVNATAHARE